MTFGYLLSIIVSIDLILIGLLVTYFFKLDLFLEARIAAGGLIGMIFFGFLMLLIANFLGLNLLSLSIFLIAVNLLGYKLLTKNNIEKIKNEWVDLKYRFRQLQWKLFFLFVASFILLFCYLTAQLLTFDKGRYFVQPGHAYGDISLHLGIISSFAFGNNFPPQNPILAGEKISYPFLADFITAIFVNPLSLRFDQAVSLVGILLMAITVIILAYFSLRITRSKLASCMVLFLFFFNGGLGFIYFFRDFQTSNLDFFHFIQVLPRDYTALKDLGFFWINVVISMLLPQRSFLLGLPAAILILYIFWDLSERFDIKKLLFGILLISLLPIIHAHSLIVLSPFLLWLTILILFKHQSRIIFFLSFGLPGLTIIFLLSKLFLQQSDNLFSLIHLQPGWMAGKQNIIPFYFNNFGFNLILIPIAILSGIRKNLKIAYFALIGQVWFILPGLFIFQPWDFDNTKFFIYWYLSAIFILAFLFSRLVLTRKITNIILVIVVVSLLNFSGILDIFRLISSSGTKYEVYSPQAIKLAEFVKNNTSRDSVFLSVDKFDNPVVTLAGRKAVLGYHAWLWTYGLDYSQREQDVRVMLAGRGDKGLFNKYNISYVVLFKGEQANYVINEEYFREKFNLIYSKDNYEIFAI